MITTEVFKECTEYVATNIIDIYSMCREVHSEAVTSVAIHATTNLITTDIDISRIRV
jgi:hypothetical protein